MSKMKNCPACGNEVAKSAKTCPHCGKKLKIGLFLKILLALVVIGFVSAIFGPSDEEKAEQLVSKLNSLADAKAASISPSGELAAAFNLMSDHTDIQRENLENEIKGQIVEWSLPVYEVRKSGEKKYRVQTSSGTNYVGTFLTLHARSPEEIAFIENIKTGDVIRFKGGITGTTMRNIDVAPALLMAR